jgi:uroporphyrinogen decarboxylase
VSISTPYLPEHVAMARELLDAARANDGLAPVDLERFWVDQERVLADPFGTDIPQVPLGAVLTDECVYAELGIDEDFWRYQHDDAWRLELNHEYNNRAERIVGKRILDETPHDPTLQYPEVKKLHDVFESRNEWHGQSWWLMQSVNNERDLEALLDRVESTSIREFILPDNWEAEKARLSAHGVKPTLYRGQRGPVTFATSVYGAENLVYLIMENPALAQRFSKAILETMLAIARVIDEEAGYKPETAPHGFAFCDDNCCLLTPDMYAFFAYPVLEGMFNRYSPDPGDLRYQHSDSAMGHLLPLLGRAGINAANFGPTVMVDEIRRHLPHAVIHGELAPFTYSRNEEENIVLEFLRDFEMARNTRGLVFTTAGSINNGSRLTSMRLAMAAVQRFGRY